MRIIGGKHRGLKLAAFSGDDIRPTADRVKESLFNIISDRVEGAEVLDLFCGSGNLGIECLSRGAAHVTFNDVSDESVKLLKKNLDRLKESNFAVYRSDYAERLARGGKFDIIFVDPPYRLDIGLKALGIIGRDGLLKDGGIAVFERDRAFQGDIQGLEKADERKYGKTFLTFFKRA